MASMWRRAMHYLGLGPDDEYDSGGSYAPGADPVSDRATEPVYGEGPAVEPAEAPLGAPPPPVSGRVVNRPVPSAPEPPSVTPVRPVGPAQPQAEISGRPGPDAGVRSTGSVRAVAVAAQLHHVEPRRFNDIQQVADRFKAGQPVAMDLVGVDRDMARRLIDFASGLCYGMGGTMERVGSDTYLVIPTGARVSPQDRERLAGDSPDN